MRKDAGRIVVSGLTKRFGSVLAVDDLSFTAGPGSVTGFLGPNGAGKTSTLRMLLGLVIPDQALRFDEADKEWRYAEPDWDELRTVVTNHGPRSQARLEFRRLAREETRWVREAILGVPRAA